ncbi:hypothetical protein TRFO_29081 [Tritrichomonas foetus]|uniref:Uncharacterized protein n=1 Tax=Tritrichomonas foetus TaxID=1144522 RepID=A0A1J4JWK5_9EUKA|nr:hypothetical protein TRFO_29081 [Tritrichomonas foetus]|eukprot:OHT03527.1 hypothetical protein TRFO_29081 [Tritrichomonas foetus]
MHGEQLDYCKMIMNLLKVQPGNNLFLNPPAEFAYEPTFQTIEEKLYTFQFQTYLDFYIDLSFFFFELSDFYESDIPKQRQIAYFQLKLRKKIMHAPKTSENMNYYQFKKLYITLKDLIYITGHTLKLNSNNQTDKEISRSNSSNFASFIKDEEVEEMQRRIDQSSPDISFKIYRIIRQYMPDMVEIPEHMEISKSNLNSKIWRALKKLFEM